MIDQDRFANQFGSREQRVTHQLIEVFGVCFADTQRKFDDLDLDLDLDLALLWKFIRVAIFCSLADA